MKISYCVLVLVTIGFSILDVITGYIGAMVKKNVSSSKMRKGLLKKAVQVVVIFASALLQWGQGYVDIGLQIPVLTVTCVFLIWMEFTSILENANKITGGKLDALVNKIRPKEKDDDDDQS